MLIKSMEATEHQIDAKSYLANHLWLFIIVFLNNGDDCLRFFYF